MDLLPGYRSTPYRTTGGSEKSCLMCGNKLTGSKDHYYFIGFCGEKCHGKYMQNE
jgi:hypothetical protein